MVTIVRWQEQQRMKSLLVIWCESGLKEKFPCPALNSPNIFLSARTGGAVVRQWLPAVGAEDGGGKANTREFLDYTGSTFEPTSLA
ncbi:hypothetical protein PPACK8108_LOCUS4265 [Phakopsora pachyrhizi]|uniref:Uncharacterized protein n=1 Tax=Phakopsora pachyrhizi TaxID=170000 RepID=A0AAV0ALV9_PHAPC|nr:hypothetical protein PPACK8108_LOCUS4265 [Phakopsora pachyrhizi]